jgi:hypothetical protein
LGCIDVKREQLLRMTDEAPSNDWVGIPKRVEVANSASNSGMEPEHTDSTFNSVLGLECFSWVRASDGLPPKQPVPDFLYRLTCMLLYGPKDVIEWQHGKIIIHKPSVLESDLLKQYFRHSNFMSFKRQLNYYGFRKLLGSKKKFGPCVYMNENVGPDIKKLLTIKVIIAGLITSLLSFSLSLYSLLFSGSETSSYFLF